ncbi:hypothetical protein E2C01_039932 [Portunus trituberculatus]|uniref:Uncharacterized protein n=1 Tax=Portunus trituberculatus TaxID=210409 RepID=A0A5B7FF38_PORTR|nr:hypothetical protein [Portunus trituberculatus]
MQEKAPRRSWIPLLTWQGPTQSTNCIALPVTAASPSLNQIGSLMIPLAEEARDAPPSFLVAAAWTRTSAYRPPRSARPHYSVHR